MRGLLPLLLLASLPAQADAITCEFDPPFAVTEDYMAEAYTQNGITRFQATLPTPSSGYRAEYGPIRLEEGEAVVTLHLLPPDGAAAAVIDRLNLKTELTIPPDVSTLRFRIERHYHWGPENITCRLRQEIP